MKIKQINFDGMQDIILSDFASDVNDKIPLGNSLYADCKETVDLDRHDNSVQIVLSSKDVKHADEGFGESILDGKLVNYHGRMIAKWDPISASDRKDKTYADVVNAGKRALVKYLNGPYNHFKKHYKKIPLVVVDNEQNEKFVNTHKLV